MYDNLTASHSTATHWWDECVECYQQVRDDAGEWCVNCGQWVGDNCWSKHKGRCFGDKHKRNGVKAVGL